MIKRRIYKNDKTDLCETYSTEDYKLKQVETNVVYGKSVIDIIEGFDKDNIPYSRYTYIETNEKDEEINIPIEEENIESEEE